MTKKLIRPQGVLLAVAACSALLAATLPSQAATTLADQPVLSAVSVPGNMALTLSVEYPTAESSAHTSNTYVSTSTYLGYFDPEKCYDYVYSNTESERYFQPAGKATNHLCSGKWSGNFMNWAATQTIDPFRWTLTGGKRSTDTTTTTILEKAFATGQGGTGNFPDRSTTDTGLISGATPLNWSRLRLRIQGLGVKMYFTGNGNNNGDTPTAYNPRNRLDADKVYEVSVRVKVCDSSDAAGGLESNCKQYGSNYKPEGLIQQYHKQMRFSAFGYLNQSGTGRDGGVMRARQKFVGPTRPVPGSADVDNAAASEWDSTTGVMKRNPDTTDASNTASAYGVPIGDSGVMNYINKFGALDLTKSDGTTLTKSYKSNDPVGELYYAAVRYFRNLGNVPEWTNPNTDTYDSKVTYADGFPVITNWDDPIQYSCQKNYILGIGDVNTHADRNVPGSSGNSTGSEPAKPQLVKDDTAFDAVTWTNRVGKMQGLGDSLGTTRPYNGCCSNNGALMAGIAYWANTQDIRPDDAAVPRTVGAQNIQTYWLDVMEYQTVKANNQFYLAAKYGGFTVPTNYDIGRTTDLDRSWWHTGPDSDKAGDQLRPDNYYTAGRPDTMKSGLETAFASIASKMKAYTSSFATEDNTVTSTGESAYASQYDSKDWTGDVIASTATLNGAGAISQGEAWRLSNTLPAQIALDGNNGWSTKRRIVTYNGTGGVAFRYANLTSAQQTALNSTYVDTNDGANLLQYLRGDRSQEVGSTLEGGSKKYRTRTSLVGDIVNSKVLVVGKPYYDLSETAEPGYAAYKTAKADRGTYLVVGANDGMVHVINGALSGDGAGQEMFAYVPAALFAGPSNTPSVDGLASLGNPTFTHHFMVDAPPVSADVNFNRTGSNARPTINDWRTIVVGGLGKGGKAVYALDLTDLSNLPTLAASSSTTVAATENTVAETRAAGKVLWEFTHASLGFTFGTPVVTRTAKYGWVVIVPSGYNNADGQNYLFILNAKTGALLDRVRFSGAGDTGTTASPSGLAYLNTFYRDVTSQEVESIYGGDLRGNVWRVDLTYNGTGTYWDNVVPKKVAKLTDASGNEQPVTTKVIPATMPGSLQRWLLVGTGQLLNTTDITSTSAQRFYSLYDGTQTVPSTAATLTATDLLSNTDPTQGVTGVSKGWYVNLGPASGTAFRVITDPTLNVSAIAFSAVQPSAANACSPNGQSRVYNLDIVSGVTQFANGAAYITANYVVTGQRFVTTEDGSTYLTISGAGGASTTCTNSSTSICSDYAADVKPSTGVGNKLINWREIPVGN